VHLAVAESDEAFVEQALGLLARPDAAKKMGEAARRLVVETASWPAMLAPLPEIVGLPAGSKARRDAA